MLDGRSQGLIQYVFHKGLYTYFYSELPQTLGISQEDSTSCASRLSPVAFALMLPSRNHSLPHAMRAV